MGSLSSVSIFKIVVGVGLIIITIVVVILLAVLLTTDDTTSCDVPAEEITSKLQLKVISDDHTFSLSWTDVEPIEMCDVRYKIQIQTDLIISTEITPMNFTVITRDQFCFFIEYQIAVMMGNSIGLPIKGSALYGLPQVEYLTLNRSIGGDTLIAMWQEHWLQKQCSLQYEVMYKYSSLAYIFIVDQPMVLFNMAYCTNTTVSVSILHNDRRGEENNVTYFAEYPTSVDRAENVAVRRSETSAFVSWSSHPFFSECNDLYTVLAEHESGQSSICQGASSCDVFLENFCPITNFTIFQTTDPDNFSKWEYVCEGHLNAI